MSQCHLDNEEDQFEVTIGWDLGGETFFAQVIDNDFDRRKTYPARRLGDDWTTPSLDPESGMILWLTPNSVPYRPYLNPDPLIKAIEPYAAQFDRATLRRELMRDKLYQDGNRSYYLDGYTVSDNLADDEFLEDKEGVGITVRPGYAGDAESYAKHLADGAIEAPKSGGLRKKLGAFFRR